MSFFRDQIAARDKRAFLYIFAIATDVACVFAGYLIAINVRDEQWLEAVGQSILVLAVPIFVLFAIAREVHSIETLESRLLAVQRALGALGATALIVMALFFFVDADQVSRVGFSVLFGSAAILLVCGKLMVDLLFKAIMGGASLQTMLLVDGMNVTPRPDEELIDVGLLNLWPDPEKPEAIDRLSNMVANYDRVVVACLPERQKAWAMFLKGHDVGGEIILDSAQLLGAVAIGQHGDHDTLIMSLGPLNLVNRLLKRVFDLVTASVAIITLSPVMILTAIAIKIDSGGPVLFRQCRVGLGNRQFEILKFRSMAFARSDADGERSADRDDDRITSVGRLIRKTSIDELPQLFNVLRGDMSMVGPRPHALGSRAGEHLFWHASNAYWMRHALKPGLTGLAQIRGFRGATDTELALQERVRSDLEYLSDWSIWSDMMILIKTLRVVVHKNAF